MSRVLAVDVGASSYRVIEGIYKDGRLSMNELARFKNEPVLRKGHYYWNVYQMKYNIMNVLKKAGKKGEAVSSIGFDTFGTDFGLLDESGKLIEEPVAYRDNLSDGMYEKYFIREEQLYKRTGGTYATTSTAHILAGMKEQMNDSLKRAGRLLFLPDLLAWLFTGRIVNEYTIATTSRLLCVEKRTWDKELIKELGLPVHIFGPLAEPGTIVGHIDRRISKGLPNLKETVVTAVACHDTASAVVTVPEIENSSFISSGSWSVKGIVSKEPYTSKNACLYKMSNEGQPEGKYRLIRNIAGLWILEECVRNWNENGMNLNIPELVNLTAEKEDFPSMIYTGAPEFEKPKDMPEKIRDYCLKTGQKIPADPTDVVRTIINGLAMEYRKHNEELEEVTGNPVKTLYIVGGGSKNRLLNQCAADASGCTVLCGHPEAAAMGNILMQLWGQKEIKSLEAFSRIAVEGRCQEKYIPDISQKKKWDERYEKYQKLRL